jgi:hypothetical protein
MPAVLASSSRPTHILARQAAHSISAIGTG